MNFLYSLRFRIVSSFCLFTALLGIIYAFFVFILIVRIEDSLFTQSLHEEVEHYLLEYKQNKHAPLPTTRHLTAFIGESQMPSEIKRLVSGLAIGFHELEDEEYHIAVQPLVDHPERAYFVYNVASLETPEMRMHKIRVALIIGIILIVGLALALGLVISRRIFAPVTQLAEQVDKVDPEHLPTDLAKNFYQDEVGILARALEKAIRRIDKYAKALSQELEEGRRVQRSFLPGQMLQKTGWEIEAFFKPARKMSGDFYDLFELPGNNLAIVIADVCGKGAGAALFMGLFQSLIQIHSARESDRITRNEETNAANSFHSRDGDQSELSPSSIDILSIIENTNRYIAENHGDTGIFATLFFGILNTADGLLTFINCGHEPPYIISATGIRKKLKSSGPVIGFLPDAEYKTGNVYLNTGDMLIGYTDGVPEARSPEDKMFTRQHFESMLNFQENRSMEEMLELIKEALFNHIRSAPQEDDITILALKRC